MNPQEANPAGIIKARMTALVNQDEFVVFLIGMRVNRPWKVHKWLPVARAMGRMIGELSARPDPALRAVESWLGRTSIMVQYWDSFDALERYATRNDAEHRPAWAAFNRSVGSNGDVGIWHETYVMRPGSYECVYNNMPRFGLARAFETAPATGAYSRAASRMAAAADAGATTNGGVSPAAAGD
jgi:hypothetical protein